MALAAGTRLGPYEVVAKIGEGGMGEVYRATDTNLKRAVALKVLPAAVASDPDRLARFQREAQVLASLNHPHIAAIYGVERADGTTALVMELVEGDDLSQRIARGAVPIEDALPIAAQIAAALEGAHELGIIHRDLKPANVKVRSDGTVKVLDFGLAKAMEPTGAAAMYHSLASTITTPAMTQAGMILGTAAYMSPEQAKGRTVDRRTDVWAFGAVLFEMLSGHRAFAGDDVADTLANVLKLEPAWARLPPDVPARVRVVLRACLQKNPKDRLADVQDARLALGGAFETEADRVEKQEGAELPTWRRAVAVAIAIGLTGLLVGLAVWAAMRPAAPLPVHLTMVHPGPEAVGGNAFDANVAVSPDGRYVAYVASTAPGNGNTLRLYVRALDQSEPRNLSMSARTPFFSPDGQWVGFVEDNQRLSKIAVTGGPAVPIGGNANGPRGASWGSDDAVVFATTARATGLMRISAAGGDAEVLSKPDASKGEVDHVFPEVLPGARAVLFTILSDRGVDHSKIAVLDLATRTYRVIVQGGSHARYSPSGHLVYGANGTLRAVAFDVGRLEVRGTAVPVLGEVVTRPSGAASFGVSSGGSLVYVRGAAGTVQATLVWVDRMGREEALGLEPGIYTDPVLSPDGTQVAVTVVEDDGVDSDSDSDVWVWSLSKRIMRRLTFESGGGSNPLWTPDGARIAYRMGQAGIFWRRADGTGVAEPILESGSNPRALLPSSWTADGRLVLQEQRAGVFELGVLQTRAGAAPTPLLRNARFPSVSPDGRWLAYSTPQGGLYVRPFPNVEAGQWQVATTGPIGGVRPRWSAGGRTLFFAAEEDLMAAAIDTTPTFSSATPVRVATWRDFATRTFDVSLDGARFLMRKSAQRDAASAAPQLDVILNWTQELTRLVPAN